MTSRRVQKVAQAIREVVSMAIIADLRDPRITDVTVTYVEVSADLRLAKVHVSVMGDEIKQNLCLHGLRSSAGIALDWYTPVGPLSFSYAGVLSKENTDKTESFRFNLGTTF